MITLLMPLIGHTGIADSEGKIYDFGGSHYVAVDNMTFGRPTKYLTLDPSKAQACDWDEAIQLAAEKFRQRNHNIFVNNCHHHVAEALNIMKYDGRQDYTQFEIFKWMVSKSKKVSDINMSE